MQTHKLNTTDNMHDAIRLIIKAGGGALSVRHASLGEMRDVLDHAESWRGRGLAMSLREVGEGFTLELRDASQVPRRGPAPGPMNEKLRGMKPGDSELFNVAEVSLSSLRATACRFNAATGSRLVVHAAKPGQTQHRVVYLLDGSKARTPTRQPQVHQAPQMPQTPAADLYPDDDSDFSH
jgi:hypothetical protein